MLKSPENKWKTIEYNVLLVVRNVVHNLLNVMWLNANCEIGEMINHNINTAADFHYAKSIRTKTQIHHTEKYQNIINVIVVIIQSFFLLCFRLNEAAPKLAQYYQHFVLV